MRALFLLTLATLATACSRSPEDQQVHQIRATAEQQADSLANAAEARAAPLDQQAQTLAAQAKQAHGYDAKRINVQADALRKQAKLLREQGHDQAAAVKEAADARIKAIRSR